MRKSVCGDDAASLRKEIALARSARGRWHSRYLGLAYRTAVESAMARVVRERPRVLKTDLWNECLGGDRDVVTPLARADGFRVFALDVNYSICALGRARVPAAHVVQADIRALPFRSGSFDAVLDLSTMDHVTDAEVAGTLGEYGRVLRGAGVLLAVYWQRSAVMRLRLLLKKLFRRLEKPGQHYLRRGRVRRALGGVTTVAGETAAGLLLTPPYRLVGFALGRLSDPALARLLRRVVALERSRAARPVVRHLAGLTAVVAVRDAD